MKNSSDAFRIGANEILKIMIDILTPKQCLFFGILSDELERLGHIILRTTRRYREVNQLLRLKGRDARVIGRYGGGTRIGKLLASAERIQRLAKITNEWKPSLIISFASPEAVRVAYGLNIPNICVNDSPHTEAVLRLTLPLSDLLFTPAMIPKEMWLPYGIDKERIIQYNAVDAAAWIMRFESSAKTRVRVGVDLKKPIVVIRLEETQASYLLEKSTEERSVVSTIVEELIDKMDAQFIFLPRYGRQILALKRSLKKFGRRVKVLDRVVDTTSLLSHSHLFIGAGGTMSAEAALLGIPTISLFPAETTIIEKYLIDHGLVFRPKSDKEAKDTAIEVMDNLKEYSRRNRIKAAALMRSMEDPIKVILDNLKRYLV